MKIIFITLFTLVLSPYGFASDCPNFSGSYGNQDYQFDIKQNSCESIETISNGVDVNDIQINGVEQRQHDLISTAKWENSKLQITVISPDETYYYLTKDGTPIYSYKAITTWSKQENNLLVDLAGFDKNGKQLYKETQKLIRK